jgi:hypothetical protein
MLKSVWMIQVSGVCTGSICTTIKCSRIFVSRAMHAISWLPAYQRHIRSSVRSEFVRNFSNTSRYTCCRILRPCDRASWQILIIKPTRHTDFSNLFWNETLNVSDSSFAHQQDFFTVHTAMVYVIMKFHKYEISNGVCHNEISQIWNFSMTYTIVMFTVNNSCWGPEELSEICRISFQNRFKKLVHLIGFIIRTCCRVWRLLRSVIIFHTALLFS